jgi:hypothetical protein
MTTESPMFPPPVDLGSNVVSLAGRLAPPADDQHPTPWLEADRHVMHTIIEWRISRATVELMQAQGDARECVGIREPMPSKGCATIDYYDRYRAIEHALTVFKPGTVRSARAMLDIVLTILAASEVDPDGALANGPVLDLVRNVRDALKGAPDETLLTH